jgi:nucleotide-binding universal stress UspA family protein
VEIIRQGREEAADLILVGAHGADFIKDLLLGTTAEKIVRKGDRSVLVVKQAAQRPYRRVLVAVDFSDNSRRALELALRLAPQAEFHALHVYAGFEGMLRGAGVTDAGIVRYQRQVAKEARQQMEAFLRSIDRRRKPIRREVWNGRAGREITTIARRLRADLVAVGTAGRTGIPYILLGSVAEHVMREAPCDVLAVRSRVSHFQLP